MEAGDKKIEIDWTAIRAAGCGGDSRRRALTLQAAGMGAVDLGARLTRCRV